MATKKKPTETESSMGEQLELDIHIERDARKPEVITQHEASAAGFQERRAKLAQKTTDELHVKIVAIGTDTPPPWAMDRDQMLDYLASRDTPL